MAWGIISNGVGVDHLHRATALTAIWRSSSSYPAYRGMSHFIFLQALCENPFKINRTIELMDCKHDEGTSLSVCLSVWKILSYTSQYFCRLFLSFTPRGGWNAFYGSASKKTVSLLCVQVPFRTKKSHYEERYLIFKKAANCMISRFVTRIFLHCTSREDSRFKN